jgi:VWFA-related protein
LKKSRLGFLLISLCCLLGVAAGTPAQQAPAASNAATVASNGPDTPAPITLNFIALDKDGKPVTDLKPEEIHFFEGNIEQKIQSLSPGASEPLTVGLFFDISASRRADSHIAEETHLVSTLLRAIWHDDDTAFLISFNDRPFVETPLTAKLEEIDEGLKKIPSDNRSSTSLYDAVCHVQPEKLAATRGRKVYVVFSDFDDNSSRNRIEDVLSVARRANLSIFPIVLDRSFGKPSDKQFEKRGRKAAQTIAEETGGEVLIPESGTQLPAVFQRLRADLEGGYQLVYTPSSTAPSGNAKTGKTRIETTRPHVKLIYPKS